MSYCLLESQSLPMGLFHSWCSSGTGSFGGNLEVYGLCKVFFTWTWPFSQKRNLVPCGGSPCPTTRWQRTWEQCLELWRDLIFLGADFSFNPLFSLGTSPALGCPGACSSLSKEQISVFFPGQRKE